MVFVHADHAKVDPTGALHAFCHAVPGAYHLMGVVLSAGGALRWFRDVVAADGDFDAIICDLRMPDMDGHSFYQWVSATKPLLADRVVFITGDALSSRASDLVLTGRQVLEKPLRPAEILAALSALHPER